MFETRSLKGLTLVRYGEGGIRTLEQVTPLQHFQCCAFDHSATSPGGAQFTIIHGSSFLSKFWVILFCGRLHTSTAWLFVGEPTLARSFAACKAAGSLAFLSPVLVRVPPSSRGFPSRSPRAVPRRNSFMRDVGCPRVGRLLGRKGMLTGVEPCAGVASLI